MLRLPQVEILKKSINWDGLPKRFMGDGELESLCTLVEMVEPKKVIEFGINIGRTAKALLREVESISEYIGVDVLPGYITPMKVQRREIPEQAAEMVINDKRVKLFVSEKGSFDLKREDLPVLDVAFIDGDHSRAGVEQDTMLARAKVRKGGLIIWHDYHDIGNVDVRDVLHDYQDQGHEIYHVKDTWIAYEIVK